MLSTALIQAECMCFNGFPMHGNHWDLRLTEQQLVIDSGTPLLSPTTAPSWPWEPWAMTQVTSMPATSASLHGRVRIGPNVGTTFSVHPQLTNLGIQFRYHLMDPSLLVAVVGMREYTVGPVQRGSNKAPHSLVFLSTVILAKLCLFREMAASLRLVQASATTL